MVIIDGELSNKNSIDDTEVITEFIKVDGHIDESGMYIEDPCEIPTSKDKEIYVIGNNKRIYLSPKQVGDITSTENFTFNHEKAGARFNEDQCNYLNYMILPYIKKNTDISSEEFSKLLKEAIDISISSTNKKANLRYDIILVKFNDNMKVAEKIFQLTKDLNSTNVNNYEFYKHEQKSIGFNNYFKLSGLVNILHSSLTIPRISILTLGILLAGVNIYYPQKTSEKVPPIIKNSSLKIDTKIIEPTENKSIIKIKPSLAKIKIKEPIIEIKSDMLITETKVIKPANLENRLKIGDNYKFILYSSDNPPISMPLTLVYNNTTKTYTHFTSTYGSTPEKHWDLEFFFNHMRGYLNNSDYKQEYKNGICNAFKNISNLNIKIKQYAGNNCEE